MIPQLHIRADVGKPYAAFLRAKIRVVSPLLPRQLDEISIALVNDKLMADLHRRFMNLDGPTDVLTFPLSERGCGGEIVICVPEARRRAKSHGTVLRNELLLYAIHGMLHLCGMDDRTQRGFKRMHRLEDQILTEIGVGAVFDPCRPKPARRKSRKRMR